MPSAEQDFLNQMPDWAIATTNGELVLGAQLPTRDGRRCGNAHIVFLQGGLYEVLTDAGTLMRLSKAEVAELFYPPQWVSRWDEVKRKFGAS